MAAWSRIQTLANWGTDLRFVSRFVFLGKFYMVESQVESKPRHKVDALNSNNLGSRRETNQDMYSQYSGICLSSGS